MQDGRWQVCTCWEKRDRVQESCIGGMKARARRPQHAHFVTAPCKQTRPCLLPCCSLAAPWSTTFDSKHCLQLTLHNSAMADDGSPSSTSAAASSQPFHEALLAEQAPSVSDPATVRAARRLLPSDRHCLLPSGRRRRRCRCLLTSHPALCNTRTLTCSVRRSAPRASTSETCTASRPSSSRAACSGAPRSRRRQARQRQRRQCVCAHRALCLPALPLPTAPPPRPRQSWRGWE